MLIHMHSSNMLLGSTPSACVPPQCCQQQNISTFRVWLVQIRFVSPPPTPEHEYKYLTRQHVRVRSYIMATVGFQRLPPVLCQFARVSEYPYLAVCFVRAWWTVVSISYFAGSDTFRRPTRRVLPCCVLVCQLNNEKLVITNNKNKYLSPNLF